MTGSSILLVVVGVLALAVLSRPLWQRLMLPPDDPLYNLRCPGCRRKLHYRASRAGKQAKCPKCKLQFAYPATTHKEENSAK